jgi:phenylalanyl-tRNA synthetase beta chain
VRVAKILVKEPHPQADRLSLLRVSLDASTEPLRVVCGASNMKVGDYVALAPVGATVPGKDGSGLTMKETKIRGELSQGMCCSRAELLLEQESEGIWILDPKKVNDSVLGRPVKEFFDEEDAVLDIDVTPNRPDCLSVRGLAREWAAKMAVKLKPQPSFKLKMPAPQVSPSIENFKDCSGFLATVIQGVKVGPSREDVVGALGVHGQRSVNNLVDVTNVVLFDYGHPIHFFDAEKIDVKTLSVRRARAGERLMLLNDTEIELHVDDLVIADQSGPLSLAGVMGGKASSVSESTTSIVMEIAAFDPALIRATARRHGLSSESSFRFERGLTAYRLEEVAERTLALLKEASGFESAQGTKTWDRSVEQPSVLWDRERVTQKLGPLSLSDNQIFEMLRRLDYNFEPKGSTTRVIFPWYRVDGECLEDVMEDLARLVGYDSLAVEPLKMFETKSPLDESSSQRALAQTLTDRLVSVGFTETLHMSFGNASQEKAFPQGVGQSVALKNPIHSEKAHLRRFLLPQLLETARKNLHHGESEIRLVEWGPVFQSAGHSLFKSSPTSESLSLAVVWLPRPMDAKKLWARRDQDLFFEFKGMLEKAFVGLALRPSAHSLSSLLHPKRQFVVGAAAVGELHPSLQKDFDLPSSVYVGEWMIDGGVKPWKFTSPAEYPSIEMDASFVMDQGLSADQMMRVFKKSAPALLEDVRVYDLFEGKALGEGRKSMTFAMRYRSSERTLTSEEIKKTHEALVGAVLKAFAEQNIALR